jgi:hypothetical protein
MKASRAEASHGCRSWAVNACPFAHSPKPAVEKLLAMGRDGPATRGERDQIDVCLHLYIFV